MPEVESNFHPPLFLRNGHLQTILPVLLPRRIPVTFKPGRLELEDGDFLDLGWRQTGSNRVAILSHGLEGRLENGYIRGMAGALNAAGWDVLAWNFRGCGEEMNRLAGFYHSGATGDLGAVIELAARTYSKIALIGFSLGGNLTLKYLGEAPVHPSVVAAAAVSVPVDLAASARLLDTRWSNGLYLRRFIKTMIAKVEAKAVHFPAELDLTGIREIKKFQQFDDKYTAPLHGFLDAADYWKRASSRQFLPGVTVPTLLLNARNDPFLTPECFPAEEARNNRCLFLETPESGGHVGFLDLRAGLNPWSERRVPGFLSEAY